MEDNARIDVTEDEQNVMCEHVPEAGPEGIFEEAAETAPQAIKVGAGAVLAVIGVAVLAVIALAPALMNTRLAMPAVKGIAMETARRYSAAAAAYNELLTLDEEVAAWGAENFAFSEGPAFSTGGYAYKRFVLLINKLDGLLYAHETASQYLPAGVRAPLRLRKLLEQMEAANPDAINETIGANLDPAINEIDPNTKQYTHDEKERAAFVLEAVREAREKDGAKERKLLYDSIELSYAASLDITSDDVGRMLAALKTAAGSEPWMYERAEIARAREMEDYAVMAEIFARRFGRNRDDDDALAGQAKALYLSGDEARAEKLMKKYGRGRTMGYMAALKAELLLREGKYEEAVEVCDDATARGVAMKEDMAAPLANGSGIMEAVAQKAAALMLQGKAREALDLLNETAEAPYGEMGQNYLCAMLAAAVLAEDTETSQGMAMYMQQSGYTLPAGVFNVEMSMSPEGGFGLDVQLLKTIEEIYTEGWGGF